MKHWTSRKWIDAKIAQAAGIGTLIWGAADTEPWVILAGAAVTVLVTVGYIKVEGDIDKQVAAPAQTITGNTT